jgi:ParB-like chromosome segregation protein Spo0J
MTGEGTSTLELAPSELGEALLTVRLCHPEAQQQMQLSLSKLGQLTPVQTYRTGAGVELIDGFKRLRAARELSWPFLRAEVHQMDAPGAKVRLWRCNAGAGLCELEEAWLVKSLYREDRISQPQIGLLLGRHKSWVCRRLTLAEGLSDELTASVRLGLLSATAAAQLGRLQRCNQDEAAQAVAKHGLTSRQTTRLVDELLAASDAVARAKVLGTAQQTKPAQKKDSRRRTPAEQLVADAWGMKRLSGRLHARLLERSLESLGEGARAVVTHELVELRGMLRSLGETIDQRLSAQGDFDVSG